MDVDKAIIIYNDLELGRDRDQIFKERIEYAFFKLAENIIHTFKFYYFDEDIGDIEKSVVAHLIQKMHKFNPSKGKAFSYFSIVAKNWLIMENKKNYKKFKTHDSIHRDDPDTLDWKISQAVGERDEDFFPDFIRSMVKWYENHLSEIFSKDRDRFIASCVLEIFRKQETIDIFNKKTLYTALRDMSGASATQITKIINVMKVKYPVLLQTFSKNGICSSGSLQEEWKTTHRHLTI